MEISESTLIKIVEGQAATAQAVIDLKDSFDKAIPILVNKHGELEKDVRKVEKKLWYFGGAGSVLGYLGTHVIDKYFKL
jgi:hypothetical protein